MTDGWQKKAEQRGRDRQTERERERERGREYRENKEFKRLRCKNIGPSPCSGRFCSAFLFSSSSCSLFLLSSSSFSSTITTPSSSSSSSVPFSPCCFAAAI